MQPEALCSERRLVSSGGTFIGWDKLWSYRKRRYYIKLDTYKRFFFGFLKENRFEDVLSEKIYIQHMSQKRTCESKRLLQVQKNFCCLKSGMKLNEDFLLCNSDVSVTSFTTSDRNSCILGVEKVETSRSRARGY